MERGYFCCHANNNDCEASDIIYSCASSLGFVVYRRKSWISWWVLLSMFNVEFVSLLWILQRACGTRV